jgi:hypothetical protein
MVFIHSCWIVPKSVNLYFDDQNPIKIEWEQIWFERINKKQFCICLPSDFDFDLAKDIKTTLIKEATTWIHINYFMGYFITSVEFKGQKYLCWRFICDTIIYIWAFLWTILSCFVYFVFCKQNEQLIFF